MKVAVFSPYATVLPHFETELELLQRHLDQGDQVELLACLGKLTNCDFNVDKRPSRCTQCVGRRQSGLSLLSECIPCRELGKRARPSIEVPKFDSIEALADFRIDNFEIGYAVLSSVVSSCREPQPDLRQHVETIRRLIASAVTTYEETIEYCRRQNPDRVYVFNGRFAAMRAVLRGCQIAGVDCFLHERGCDFKHYDLFKNALPHDIPYVCSEIERVWNEESDEQKRWEIGCSWYEDRINRVERNWRSFVKKQTVGKLPDDWNPDKRNMAIYTTSEDEFVAIGDCWKNPLYSSQSDAIATLARDLQSRDSNIHLYVRVHPNLINVDNSSTRRLSELDGPNLTVLAANDKIDSYELLKASEKILSFGSSVGIEAAYWEKPSVLLGPCFYQDFDSVYKPSTHREAVELIASQLSPRDKSAAIKYGYWFQSRGYPFQYFEPTDFFEGTFKGKVIYSRDRLSLGRRIEKQVRKIRDFVLRS